MLLLTLAVTLLAPPVTIARLAATPEVRPIARHRDVITREGVAALAMRLRATPVAHKSGADSSAQILTSRDGLKMSGIHTSPIAAKVIQVEPTGNWTNERFVSEPMRVDIAERTLTPGPDTELAVASEHLPASPEPARIGDKQVSAEAFDGACPVLFHTMKYNISR